MITSTPVPKKLIWRALPAGPLWTSLDSEPLVDPLVAMVCQPLCRTTLGSLAATAMGGLVTFCGTASKGGVASIVRDELAMRVAVASCSVGPAIANPLTLKRFDPVVIPKRDLGAISVMTPLRTLPFTVNAGSAT